MVFRGYKYTYNLNAYHDISNNLNNNHKHTFTIILYISHVDASKFALYSELEYNLNKYLDDFQEVNLNEQRCFEGICPTLENTFFIELSKIVNDGSYFLEKVELSDNLLSWVSASKAIIPGSCMNIIR